MGHHRPEPIELVVYFVWPREYGGPAAGWNVEWLCATTAHNGKVLMGKWIEAGGEPEWDEQVVFSPFVRELVRRGWELTPRGARKAG